MYLHPLKKTSSSPQQEGAHIFKHTNIQYPFEVVGVVCLKGVWIISHKAYGLQCYNGLLIFRLTDIFFLFDFFSGWLFNKEATLLIRSFCEGPI